MVGSPAVPCCSVSTLVEGAAHSTWCVFLTRDCLPASCLANAWLSYFKHTGSVPLFWWFFSDCHKVCSEFLVLIFIVYNTQEVYLCMDVVRSVVWQICTMWYALDARLGITCRGLYAGEAQQCPACSKKSCKCSSQHSHHELYRCSVLCVSVSLQEWIISRFCCPQTAIAIFHSHSFSIVVFSFLTLLLISYIGNICKLCEWKLCSCELVPLLAHPSSPAQNPLCYLQGHALVCMKQQVSSLHAQQQHR